MEAITVEKVVQDPGPVLAGLVDESSAQGFSNLRRLVADWSAGTSRFDCPGEGLYVAIADGRVVGVCALSTAPGERVGRLRDMYVSATRRRSGIGRELVRRVVDEAVPHFSVLELRAETPGALVFYESLGFRPTPGTSGPTHRLDLRSAASNSART
jgi:GNAT superfamily N-acetyltransferase